MACMLDNVLQSIGRPPIIKITALGTKTINSVSITVKVVAQEKYYFKIA